MNSDSQDQTTALNRKERRAAVAMGERRPRSVPEFCEHWGICRATFYRHGPEVTKIGRRSVITPAAEDAWKAQRGA